jgi:hypothetical protein
MARRANAFVGRAASYDNREPGMFIRCSRLFRQPEEARRVGGGQSDHRAVIGNGLGPGDNIPGICANQIGR